MGLFSLIKNLVTYKGPPMGNQFELLEDASEKGDPAQISKDKGNPPQTPQSEMGKNNGKDDTHNSPESKESRGKKVPLRVDEWNMERKQDSAAPDIANSREGGSISDNLEQNRLRIMRELNIPTNVDAMIRDLRIGKSTKAFIAYIEGMVDRTTINDFILRPLMTVKHFNSPLEECSANYILENILSIDDVTKASDYTQIISQILEGLTALFIEGSDSCLLIESRGFEKRSVDQPVTESVISGPHEAFIEDLQTNLSLVRKIIKNKNLITEILPIGKTNNSRCGIMYIGGIVNTSIVDEVKRRIQSIDIDFILGDGMLSQLIEDHPLALFPQILRTERPDRTASFLVEGKVIIICDGTPHASIVPVTFFHMMQTSEDSFLRWQFGTFLRLIRFMGMGLAMLLPGFYLALTLFHHEMIPTELILAIEKSRENVPFPAILEILLMEFSFELIREAGIRVPDVIGQTLGIIGALILGQSAVAANLVSPILVIIVAITGLGSFSMPNHDLAIAIRIIKFVFIALGAAIGFYGIAMGIFVIGGFACNMKSFGVPYFSPVAPRTRINLDVIFKGPLWKQTLRPDPSNTLNRTRSGDVVRGWIDTGEGGEQE